MAVVWCWDNITGGACLCVMAVDCYDEKQVCMDEAVPEKKKCMSRTYTASGIQDL